MTDKKVIVYTTSICPYCVQAKNYLKSKGIKFEEINVGNDREKAMQLIQRTGQTGVPQIEIDGEFVIGFNQEKIDELLGI